MAKVTIFGLSGTGKSSAGRKLAAELGYSYHSSGNMFREQAARLGLDVYQLVELSAKDPSYDRILDEEVATFGRENDGFIFEGRLAWHFIPDSFKVKFICDFNERVRRVAERDGTSFEDAKAKTLFREETGIRSYEKVYGITEFAPDRLFNMIVDTTSIPIDKIVAKIRLKIGALPDDNRAS